MSGAEQCRRRLRDDRGPAARRRAPSPGSSGWWSRRSASRAPMARLADRFALWFLGADAADRRRGLVAHRRSDPGGGGAGGGDPLPADSGGAGGAGRRPVARGAAGHPGQGRRGARGAGAGRGAGARQDRDADRGQAGAGRGRDRGRCSPGTRCCGSPPRWTRPRSIRWRRRSSPRREPRACASAPSRWPRCGRRPSRASWRVGGRAVALGGPASWRRGSADAALASRRRRPER